MEELRRAYHIKNSTFLPEIDTDSDTGSISNRVVPNALKPSTLDSGGATVAQLVSHFEKSRGAWAPLAPPLMEPLTDNGLSDSDEGKDETDSVKTLEANITYKVVSR